MVIDTVSGTVPFKEREGGAYLMKIVNANDLIQVEQIDRLGRDAVDLINTISYFKKKGIIIEVKNLGVKSHLENGKLNPSFDLVVNILAVIAQQTKDNILELQKKGIAKAKLDNKYSGRKKGTVVPRDKFLAQNTKAVSIIKKYPEMSLRELSKLSGVSHMKVRKIKEML